MQFKVIDGFESYGINEIGEVFVFKKKNRSREKYRKWNITGGRALVQLSKNGIKKGFQVSRLVAEAFIPNPDNLPCVLHLDDDPLNNDVKNLKWGTPKENMDLSWLPEKGRQAPNRKLLYQLKDGVLIRIFKSGYEAKKFGFNNKAISKCCLGQRTHHKNFQWKYA